MVRRVLLAAAALAAATALVLVLAPDRDAGAALPALERAERAPSATDAGAALLAIDEESARRAGPVAGETVPVDAADVATSGAGPGIAAPDPLLVRVVEDDTGAPVPNATVSLALGGGRPFQRITDENGELELDLAEIPARPGDQVWASVSDDHGRPRLRELVAVDRDVVLRIPPALVLRGEVVLTSGRSPAGLTISAWNPPDYDGGAQRFLAHDELDADGRFELAAGLMSVPASFHLRVGGVGVPWSGTIATSELTSAEGARIVVGLARLAIVVLQDDGAPISRAHVRCAVAGSEPDDTELSAEAGTGEDGRTHMWVPTGPISVAAGSPAHAPANARVVLEQGEREIVLRLRPLGAADRLHGSVVFEDGTPVPAALVSAWSADVDGELTVASMRQIRTDDEGRFTLAVATDAELRVYAFHREHGETDEETWRPGDGAVELVIDRGVPLRVVERGRDSDPHLSAAVDVVIVDESGRSDSIDGSRLPLTFDRVVAGRWSVFAIAARNATWARATVVVERPEPYGPRGAGAPRAVLDFQPLGFVEGRVEPPPGPGRDVFVSFEPAGWPQEAVRELLSTRLDSGGAFRLPCPGETGEIVIREPSRQLRDPGRNAVRRPARCGSPLVITLPD